jgi:hypothetical protein
MVYDKSKDDNVIDIKMTVKETDALTLVMDRFHSYSDYRKKNYDTLWDESWKQYRSRLAYEKNYEYMARLFIPYSFTAVETAIPRIIEAFFAQDPIMAVKPTVPDDVEDAEYMQIYQNHQLRLMDYAETFLFQDKDVLVTGTTFAKVDWKKDIRKQKKLKLEEYNELYEEVPEMDDMLGMPTGKMIKQPIGEPKKRAVYSDGYDKKGNPKGTPVVEEYDIEKYNDPYVYYVDPYKLFIDPNADPVNPIESAEAIIFVTETTIDELEGLQTQGVYKNISKVKQVMGSTDFDYGDERFKNVDIKSPKVVEDKHSGKVLLYEYWEDNRVITIAEEKIVIRDSVNPYWHCRKPFVMARICPVPNEIYGVGLMEMVKCLQNELNDVRNARMDNVKLALNSMWIVARDADVDLEKLISEPGGVILANYAAGVQPLKQDDVTQSSFAEASAIADDIDRTLGVHDPARGKPTSRETATGVLSLIEQASMRFKLMIMILGKMFAKIGEFMTDLNQQYAPTEKVIRLTGGDFKRIPVQDIIHRYDYEPVGAALEGLTKYARIEQLLRVRNTVTNNPEFNLTELDKEILTLLNYKNVEKYFKQMLPPPGMQGMPPGMEGMGGGIPQLPEGAGQMPFQTQMEQPVETEGAGAPPFNQAVQ